MSNTSTASIDPIVQSVGTDPNTCLVSGYLKNVSGNPLKGWSIEIRHLYNPTGIVTDTLVLQERLSFAADADGYVEFELIRGATVAVELPNLITDFRLQVEVPDAPTCALVDLLLPYVVSVDWVDAPGPLDISVDQVYEICLEATMSNGQVVPVPVSAAAISSSDSGVLLRVSGHTFKGVAVGTANVSVDSFDPDKVSLREKPDGSPIYLLDVPAPTLPADLVVNVIS
jgi:hypothetical protein